MNRASSPNDAVADDADASVRSPDNEPSPDAVSLRARLHENVHTVQSLADASERRVSAHQHRIERWARALGHPRTLMLLILCVAIWIAINATAHAPLDPPPFFWLQGSLALYAALTTTLVLIAQTRQTTDADRRAHLELHVNLLAEQKASKIIALLEELRRDLPNVHNRQDPVADAMQEQVDPVAVHEAIEMTSPER